jgi:hypothetical protein
LLVVRRILRRRGSRLLVVGLLRLAAVRLLRSAALVAPARIALRRHCLRTGTSAAEQATEETAARLGSGLLGLLRGLLRLLQFPLQPLDTVLRFGQCVFLYEGKLGDSIAGLRILIKGLGDVGVGVAVDGR